MLRTWWALRSQKRRRNAATPLVVPKPVITSGVLVVSEVNPLWLDALVGFTFDGTGLPAGTLEVQGFLESDYGNWQSRLTVAVGASGFRDDMVFTSQDAVTYRMRFVSGTVTGPWSDEVQVTL
jgi:hypothetical protein